MVKNLIPLLGIMSLLVFSALPAVSGVPLGVAQVSASKPVCAAPFEGSPPNSSVRMYPFGSTNISTASVLYYLEPGECALYSFILTNTTAQAKNWYDIGDFANVTGMQWWLIPASQLNTFFSSGYSSGGIGPFGTNETVEFANIYQGSTWYVYAVNKGMKLSYFAFGAEGGPSVVFPGPATSMMWLTVTLVPGESYTLEYNYLHQNPFLFYGGANSTTLTWTLTSNDSTLYTESGIDPNISGLGFINENLSMGHYNFTVVNTGSAPVFVGMYAFNIGYTGTYVVVNHQQTTTTTTSTTSTTTTTSSKSTTSTTSTTTTTSTSLPSPVSPTPTPVAHSSIPTYVYIIVAVLVVVIAVLAVLVLRKR